MVASASNSTEGARRRLLSALGERAERHSYRTRLGNVFTMTLLYPARRMSSNCYAICETCGLLYASFLFRTCLHILLAVPLVHCSHHRKYALATNASMVYIASRKS